MNASSGIHSLRTLRKARLFAGLALALAGNVFDPASASTPARAHDNDTGTRLSTALHDQRVALQRQLAARAHAVPSSGQRAAGSVAVANCNDSGAGSLREALANAVSGDVIDLGALACSSITLSSGELVVGVDDLTIQGPGAAELAIDAGNASRILHHQSDYGTLTIDGLAFRNGSYVYDGPGIYASAAPGGCILGEHFLTISNSTFEHCSASGKSVSGAAIDALGALTLSDSTISGTTATATASDISATIYGGVVAGAVAYLTDVTISDASVSVTSTSAFAGLLGAGVFAMYGMVLTDSSVSGVHASVTAAKDAYAKGGGVASPSTIILSGSTISDNSVHGTPGVGASGEYIYTSAIGGGGVYIVSIPRGLPVQSTITNSTISGNSAICDGDPGAYTAGGGGGLVSWSARPVLITNSTVSGNSTNLDGGGLYTRHLGSIELANSTITDNSARSGAGIADQGSKSPYDLVTHSSIVAGNHVSGDDSSEIITSHTISGANNLITSANVALPAGTLSGDPLLAPLADNGGLTWTHALLPGSVAIDAGSNDVGLDTDQRGGNYVRVFGAAADIGAFESQPVADFIFVDGFDVTP